MDRLVAFGCSNTFGQGLPDPSKLSWPQLLANKLDIECYNGGVLGASNKQIMNQVMTFPFRTTDVCIVMWSYLSRYTILDQEYGRYYTYQELNHDNQILPQMLDNRKSKYYYRYVYNETDHLNMTLHYINYTKLHLEKLNIKNYHTCCDELDTPLAFNIEFEKLRHEFPKGTDNSHPGIDAHAEVAERIYKRILL